jgi:ATP-dependent Clp protease adaptor protein ClpS
MLSAAAAPGVTPAVLGEQGPEHGRLFHVVLLDDDEHTYEYVIEMLQKLFFLSLEDAFQRAVEVDTTGRTIVITCEFPEAEFARDQIHGFGADPRMPKSKGSMSAVLVPAGSVTAA